ncbi:MAG: hypothetical protein ACFE8B_00605 [Candidatus Hermodarchaeota archaeon]
MPRKKQKSPKIIVKHERIRTPQEIPKESGYSNEFFTCMRKEINSWDQHMMLMFFFSRKV